MKCASERSSGDVEIRDVPVLLGSSTVRPGRENGIEPDSVRHGHFGTVNSFPEWVWDVALERMRADGKCGS